MRTKYVVYGYTVLGGWRRGWRKPREKRTVEYAGTDGREAYVEALVVAKGGPFVALRVERWVDGKEGGYIEMVLPPVGLDLADTLRQMLDFPPGPVVFAGTAPEDRTGMSGPLVDGPLKGAV